MATMLQDKLKKKRYCSFGAFSAALQQPAAPKEQYRFFSEARKPL